MAENPNEANPVAQAMALAHIDDIAELWVNAKPEHRARMLPFLAASMNAAMSVYDAAKSN